MGTKVFNDKGTTLYDISLNVSQFLSGNRKGLAYSVNTGQISISGNGFLVIQITNPASSENTMQLTTASGGSQSSIIVDIFKNATFAAAGTSLTPINLNWSYSNSSSMTAKYTTASSGNDPTNAPANSLIDTIISTNQFIINKEYLIPSDAANQTFYIRITNSGSGTNIVSATIIWIELDDGTELIY